MRHEAEVMLPVLEELYPGISLYSEHVVFKAFNEMPSDPQRTYTTYGVVVEVSRGDQIGRKR